MAVETQDSIESKDATSQKPEALKIITALTEVSKKIPQE